MPYMCTLSGTTVMTPPDVFARFPHDTAIIQHPYLEAATGEREELSNAEWSQVLTSRSL